MYRILVAIDGSEHARRAVAYAAKRAATTPCRIDLLHVEAPVMAWEVGAISSSENAALAHGIASRDLLDAGARAFDQDVDVGKLVVQGEPARTILEQAAKLGADEIIIGSRGLRPLGAALLGSVAYKVLHEARVAVVVVH